MPANNTVSNLHIFLLASLAAVLVWSGINPHDYFTWFLEVLPAILAVGILAFFYNRFRFTNLVYVVVWFHCIVLLIGAKYTYAEVPLGFYAADLFGWSRNNYDKIGHFMQGFTPALVTREIFIRKNIVNGRRWIFFLSIAVPLAFSAFYELVEWWISIAAGSAGDSFLGTQGYVWDTQSDMFMCMIGSILALLLLSGLQSKEISELDND